MTTDVNTFQQVNTVKKIVIYDNDRADVVRVLQFMDGEQVVASGEAITQVVTIETLAEAELEPWVSAVLLAAWDSAKVAAAAVTSLTKLRNDLVRQQAELNEMALAIENSRTAIAAAQQELNAEQTALAQRSEQITADRLALFHESQAVAAQRALL